MFFTIVLAEDSERSFEGGEFSEGMEIFDSVVVVSVTSCWAAWPKDLTPCRIEHTIISIMTPAKDGVLLILRDCKCMTALGFESVAPLVFPGLVGGK